MWKPKDHVKMQLMIKISQRSVLNLSNDVGSILPLPAFNCTAYTNQEICVTFIGT